jgi:hypothetical protein
MERAGGDIFWEEAEVEVVQHGDRGAVRESRPGLKIAL